MMITFTSASGSEYIYDDSSGFVFPAKPVMKEVIETYDLGEEKIVKKLSEKYPEGEILYYFHWLEKVKKAYNGFSPYNITFEDPTVEEVKDLVLREGIGQLILGVTENCNMRCRYCIYSDNYKLFRDYSFKRMPFETAKKAIDYYFSLFEEALELNPNRDASIGFYGGEPLLEFDLIKKCIEYTKQNYSCFEPQFNMTTNGTLLTKERADYLMENNVSIAVSLDGPKEEHDRKRVYVSGGGTFDDVMKNVSYLISKGYDKIHALPVYDWKTDITKVNEFFNREDIPQALVVSSVNTGFGCTYFDSFSKEDYAKFKENMKRAETLFLQELPNYPKKKISYIDSLFGRDATYALFMKSTVVTSRPPYIPCTGSCVPGRKIYVDCDGNYHMCERINDKFPIGHVDTGLNFEMIINIIRDYQKVLKETGCVNCKVRRMCSNCFCMFAGESCFVKMDCSRVVESVKDRLAHACTIGEINPEFFGQYDEQYNKELRKVTGRRGSYD